MAPRILLADIADGDLKQLAQVLRDAGYIVCNAIAPRSPMEAFEQVPADAIVLHLGQPQAEASCKALRGHALGATVPVIFVAGPNATIDSPAAALAVGADALWRLPLDTASALKRLTTFVGPARPHISVVAAAQAMAGPPPPAKVTQIPRLARLFGKAPRPATRQGTAPAALAMAPPPALRRSPPPAWPPRGMGGGAAVAVQEPELCVPWSDPDALAREHIRESCAQMQVADYYTLANLPTDAPYLVIDRALKHLQAEFMPEHFSLSLRHEARLELARIAQMLEEARFVLADAGRREAYTKHMRQSMSVKR